jgi:hypothetical protein
MREINKFDSQNEEFDSSKPADGVCDVYEKDCWPNNKPFTDIPDFKKDAQEAFDASSRENFIAAEVAKLKDYNTRPDYDLVEASFK